MKKLILLVLTIFFSMTFMCCKVSEDDVDYDFSKHTLPNFAGLQNMTTLDNYKDYSNKIIKIKGEFQTTTENNNTYYLVIVKDPNPQRCCSDVQVEFILKDGKYPKLGSTITVMGKLKKYKEGQQDYLHLIDAVLL